MVSKDERQKEAIRKWIKAKARGIMVFPTGFGKTFTALKCVNFLKTKKDDVKVIIIVPHKQLQQQWILEVSKFNLLAHCEVLVINSAIKKERSCDLLICDEVHAYLSPKNIKVFSMIRHKRFLGLTGTLERSDGKHKTLIKTYPIVDKIEVEEAIANKWISDYKQVKVEIEVDLTEYEEFNKAFNHHFSFFDYNFQLAMDCLSDEEVRLAFAQQTKQSVQMIMIQAMGFIRSLSGRKNFIYNHLAKVDVANKIIKSRLGLGKKIMTFTKTVEHALHVCCGDIYHGDLKKLEKDKILKNFNNVASGVLNTAKALDLGTDVKGVNVAVVLSSDSSKTTKSQRSGRALRFEENKEAEIWHLVLKGTMDEKWFENSNDNRRFFTISHKDLDDYLAGKEVKPQEEKQVFTLLL